MSPLSRILSFFPLALLKPKPYAPQNTRKMSTDIPPSQVATFAAGCFWGVEHIFLKQWPVKENKGILKTSVGYTGGYSEVNDPTYRQVCSGDTNHAEALRIEFDPTKVSYDELVGPSGHLVLFPHNYPPDLLSCTEYFYRTHDPTTLNSQGADRGTRAYDIPSSASIVDISYTFRLYAEYRSAIFFHTPEQESIARRVTQEVQEKRFTPKEQKVLTTIETAGPWYDAEDYHQEYLFKNPRGYQCPTHKLHW
jgi:peptide-methionine (S)-S-oxide reductase